MYGLSDLFTYLLVHSFIHSFNNLKPFLAHSPIKRSQARFCLWGVVYNPVLQGYELYSFYSIETKSYIQCSQIITHIQ